MSKRRDLTPVEREAATNLQAIWDQKRKSLNLTQEKMAHECGWGSQGAFNQYLKGRIPLNVAAILKISNVLGISPDEISKEIMSTVGINRVSDYIDRYSHNNTDNMESSLERRSPSSLIKKLAGRMTPRTMRILEDLTQIENKVGLNEHDLSILEAIIKRYENTDT